MQAIETAITIRAALQLREPQNHRYAVRCARSLLTKAGLEIQLWQHQGADRRNFETTLGRAAAAMAPLQAGNHEDIDVVLTFASMHSVRAQLLANAKRYAEATQVHREIGEALRASLTRFETVADLHYQLALHANNLLHAQCLAGAVQAAIKAGDIEDGIAALQAMGNRPELGEVQCDAIRHPQFAPRRGRPDYQALLDS